MRPSAQIGTIPQLLRWRTAASPDAPALGFHSETGWRFLSWATVAEQVETLALGLRALGCLPGSRVAIAAGTRYEWQLAEWAALHAGASVVGLDPHAPPHHQAAILDAVRPMLLVTDEDRLAEGSGPRPTRIQLDPARRQGIPIGELLARGSTGHLEDAPAAESEAAVFYTSGTTGLPKGIPYSHRQMLAAVHALSAAFPEAGTGSRHLAWLPMAGLFQRIANLHALQQGLATAFCENPKRVLADLREIQPSLFIAVPRLLQKIFEALQHPGNGKVSAGQVESRDSNAVQAESRDSNAGPACLRTPSTDPAKRVALDAGAARSRETSAIHEGSMPPGTRPATGKGEGAGPGGLIPSKGAQAVRVGADPAPKRLRGLLGPGLQYIVTGSAPTPPWLLHWYAAAGIRILEAYGVSECVVPLCTNKFDDYRLGSVGKPLPGVELRLANDGEILVRSPGLFDGYLGRLGVGDRFEGDGYYRTGDLGRLDADGYLFLQGRKCDLLKTATGRRIHPQAIEALLSRSPLIEELLVVGEGRPFLGALIVPCWPQLNKRLGRTTLSEALSPGTRAEAEQIIRDELRILGARMATYERVRVFALLEEPFQVQRGERTATLKLRRATILERYGALIESLYNTLPNDPHSRALAGDPDPVGLARVGRGRETADRP